MSKQVRLKDNYLLKLREIAEHNRRPMSAQIELWIDKEYEKKSDAKKN